MAATGIIGTGRMGTAIAKRLLECGHEVHVWNRSPGHAAEAVAAGAVQAPDLQALVAGCDVILSSLTDHAALDGVYASDAALQRAMGKTFVEMSTILPREQQALAAKAEAAGASYLECPVGGTVGPALKGQLLGFAGGDDAAWATAKPILERLCKRVEHLGPIGAGSRMKLAVNLPLALYWATLGEAVSLLDVPSLGGERIVSLLADSTAGPNALRARGPVVAAALDGQDQIGTFDLAGLRKDLVLALRLAHEEGRNLPVSEAALAHYETALAQGMGELDGASLARSIAKVPLRF